MGTCRGLYSIACAAEPCRKNGTGSSLSQLSPLQEWRLLIQQVGCPTAQARMCGSRSQLTGVSRIGLRNSPVRVSPWQPPSRCASPWLRTRRNWFPWRSRGTCLSRNLAADANGCATTQNSSERQEATPGRSRAPRWRTIRIGAVRSTSGKSLLLKTSPNHSGTAGSYSTSSTFWRMVEHSGAMNSMAWAIPGIIPRKWPTASAISSALTISTTAHPTFAFTVLSRWLSSGPRSRSRRCASTPTPLPRAIRRSMCGLGSAITSTYSSSCSVRRPGPPRTISVRRRKIRS